MPKKEKKGKENENENIKISNLVTLYYFVMRTNYRVQAKTYDNSSKMKITSLSIWKLLERSLRIAAHKSEIF